MRARIQNKFIWLTQHAHGFEDVKYHLLTEAISLAEQQMDTSAQPVFTQPIPTILATFCQNCQFSPYLNHFIHVIRFAFGE